jgi:hypothetical protein
MCNVHANLQMHVYRDITVLLNHTNLHMFTRVYDQLES